MFTLTKQFRFEASHQLMHHDGKCARLHGHSWVGRVILEFEHLAQTGPKQNMALDYADIKAYLTPIVDGELDHYHLNHTLGTDSPTSEFVARYVYIKLARTPLGIYLAAVEIDETCTSSCRYEGSRP